MKQLLMVCILATSLFACKKETQPVLVQPISKTYPLTGFTKIEAADNLDLQITKSNSFSITAIGKNIDVNDLSVAVANGKLKLGYENNTLNRSKVAIEIKMPSLIGFDISKMIALTVTGFSESVAIEGKLTDNCSATVTLNAPQIKFDLTNKSVLTVAGNAEEITINATDNSKANSYAVAAKVGKVVVTNNSEVKVYTTDALFASANINSVIFFRGNPGNKFFSELDSSKINAD